MSLLGLQYREMQPQNWMDERQENREFSEQQMPKEPILYFAGHYPNLPPALLERFLQEVTAKKTGVLYHPSREWWGEREVLARYWNPCGEGHLEKTLASPQQRLRGQEDVPVLEAQRRRMRNLELLRQGVIIPDPDAVSVAPSVQIEAGTRLYPGTILTGECRIGSNCIIGPNTEIQNCQIGRDCRILQSQLLESVVKDEVKIGPFAYIRPHSVIGSRVKIGDFVEIKNSVIGEETMISHLTYVGDADVGSHVNFGCGTVIVNYDGIRKHRSVIEDYAFIGCNSNLISPVTIGESAYIGAGSTITKNVPAESLGIARARQENINHWVTKRKEIKGGNK